MNVLLVHNRYGKFSGEELVFDSQRTLLAQNGWQVITFERRSEDIARLVMGRFRAFTNGVYNSSAKNSIRKQLAECRPDVVHIHNLFPLISPAVLPECRRAGVPVVMTVHNYRLVCPNGLHMIDGRVCEKCKGGKEYWCVLRNCEGSLGKSLGYALRNYVARIRRYYLDNVSAYAALTEFQRQRMTTEGFPADRISVVPNMCMPNGFQPSNGLGDHVGYVGRLSPEKGVSDLLVAARMLSRVPFRAAGSLDRMPALPGQASANLQFVGHLEQEALDRFYIASRMIVVPSTWYEGFPNVIVQAMMMGKPVVCSRIGGLPEIVDDGVTGLLFEPGNAADLAEKIRYLWDRPDLCRQMGQAGREKALHTYSPEKYYERLMAVYEKAIELGAPQS